MTPAPDESTKYPSTNRRYPKEVIFCVSSPQKKKKILDLTTTYHACVDPGGAANLLCCVGEWGAGLFEEALEVLLALSLALALALIYTAV